MYIDICICTHTGEHDAAVTAAAPRPQPLLPAKALTPAAAPRAPSLIHPADPFPQKPAETSDSATMPSDVSVSAAAAGVGGGRGAGRGSGPRSLVTRRRRAALAYVSAPICSIYNYVIIIITIYVVCSIYAALAYVSGPICVCMLMHVCVHIQRFLAGRRRRAAKALVQGRVRLRCSVRALGA